MNDQREERLVGDILKQWVPAVRAAGETEAVEQRLGIKLPEGMPVKVVYMSPDPDMPADAIGDAWGRLRTTEQGLALTLAFPEAAEGAEVCRIILRGPHKCDGAAAAVAVPGGVVRDGAMTVELGPAAIGSSPIDLALSVITSVELLAAEEDNAAPSEVDTGGMWTFPQEPRVPFYAEAVASTGQGPSAGREDIVLETDYAEAVASTGQEPSAGREDIVLETEACRATITVTDDAVLLHLQRLQSPTAGELLRLRLLAAGEDRPLFEVVTPTIELAGAHIADFDLGTTKEWSDRSGQWNVEVIDEASLSAADTPAVEFTHTHSTFLPLEQWAERTLAQIGGSDSAGKDTDLT